MTIFTKIVVYPDGDTQEVSQDLRINDVVDLNGNPLRLPLTTDKVIAYRVYKKTTKSTVGEEVTAFHLELLNRIELQAYR